MVTCTKTWYGRTGCFPIDDMKVNTKITARGEGPEHKIQRRLIAYLKIRGWTVEVMHGNAFQHGIPDLYLHHQEYGPRWVDCKNPGKYSFTKAQRAKWPYWDSVGIGIWILTAANQAQYDKLFGPPNWKDYWRKSWALPSQADLDKMLEELIAEAEAMNFVEDPEDSEKLNTDWW